MEKRQIRLLNIFPTAEGSYFLVMEDVSSLDKFGIITFQSEASYILSFFFEKKTPRPSIYEVFSNYLSHTKATFQEAILTKYRNNVYHAEMICRQESGETLSFDIRATDAIAMAFLNKRPIYATVDVIQECSAKYGAIIDRLIEKKQGLTDLNEAKSALSNGHSHLTPQPSYEEQLRNAIENEDYERAAKLKREHEQDASGEQPV